MVSKDAGKMLGDFLVNPTCWIIYLSILWYPFSLSSPGFVVCTLLAKISSGHSFLFYMLTVSSNKLGPCSVLMFGNIGKESKEEMKKIQVVASKSEKSSTGYLIVRHESDISNL